MADISGFAQEVLGVGFVVSALLGMAAFLGRSQIAHWLNKDIERIKVDFQKELELEKSNHQKALEAFRVSLISESERSKANQAVQTAVALRFSEHQFEAINAVNIAYCDLGKIALKLYNLYTIDSNSTNLRREAIEKHNTEFDEKHKDFVTAVYAVSIFMKDEDVYSLHEFQAKMCALVHVASCKFITNVENPFVDLDLPHLQEVILLEDMNARCEFVHRNEEKIGKILKRYARSFINMTPHMNVSNQ